MPQMCHFRELLPTNALMPTLRAQLPRDAERLGASSSVSSRYRGVRRRGRRACRTPSSIRRHPGSRRECRRGSCTIFVRPPTSSSSTRTSVVRGMALGHAHVRGRQHVAVLVGHGLGVDESLVLDDLAVLAGEPHLHRAVRASASPCTPGGCRRRARPSSRRGWWRRRGRTSALKCSGSVHICQMRSTGASKVRSITTASCDAVVVSHRASCPVVCWSCVR